MWVAIGLCRKDFPLAKALVQWIAQLNSSLSHGALIICDPDVEWADAHDLLVITSKAFQRTEIVVTNESWQSWPAGPNALFKRAAQFFQNRKIGPWLWLEPDAIPLKAGWLDKIEQAYFAAGKPFLGSITEANELNMPSQYLPGTAVYPMDAWKRMSVAWQEDKAFDVATAPVTVPFAADTPLIQHFWGQKDLPPIFVAEKTAQSPVNAFTLARINPEAVVWHRNKDGSLLKLLGYRESVSKINLDVVMPFFSGDAKLMLKNINWMNFLHGKKDVTCVLVADKSASSIEKQIYQSACAVFERVIIHRYSASRAGWPGGPNCAFQEACRFMASREGTVGWFWNEPDAIPVVSDWLEQLSHEYEKSGKAFMGTIIGDMGHMNGVAVYPRDVPRYCKGLAGLSGAWDTVLNDEIIPHRHMANHLIQHHRGPPSFASESDLNAVEKGVVVFHPDKSGNLTDRLVERMTK